jgi:hypothetical protein
MDRTLDLQDLEERVFRSRFGDGLIDLFLGVFLLLMGSLLGTEAGGLAGVWGAMLFPMWKPVHDRLIVPRLGYVAFSEERRGKLDRKRLMMALALGVSLLAGVGMWVVSAHKDGRLMELLEPLGPTPFGFMLALMVAVGSRLLSLTRGYLYAAMILVFVAGGHLAGVDLGPSLLAAGVVVTVAGAVCLGRFLRSHPVLETGDHDAAA